MQLPIYIEKLATEAEFVAYWSSRYVEKRDHLYSPNVGKRLTPRRVLELFEWKNGGPIARHKLKSIQRNYINQKLVAPPISDREKVLEFIRGPGGAIWRIFWLHCSRPLDFPIFDQHVYRAMKYIQTTEVIEIPSTNPRKAIAYIDEYLKFHAIFKHKDKKQLDQALWAYGKFLKGNAP